MPISTGIPSNTDRKTASARRVWYGVVTMSSRWMAVRRAKATAARASPCVPGAVSGMMRTRSDAIPRCCRRSRRPLQSWQLYMVAGCGSVRTTTAASLVRASLAVVGSRSHSWLASEMMASGFVTGRPTTSRVPAILNPTPSAARSARIAATAWGRRNFVTSADDTCRRFRKGLRRNRRGGYEFDTRTPAILAFRAGNSQPHVGFASKPRVA